MRIAGNSWLKIVIAAGLLVQALILSGGIGASASPTGPILAWILLPAALIVLTCRSGFRDRGRRIGPVVLILAQLLLLGSGIRDLTDRLQTPEEWIEAREADLTPRLERFQSTVPALLDRIALLREREPDTADDADPFTALAATRRLWSESPSADLPLGLTYWVEGERVAWSGPQIPFPLGDLPEEVFLPLVVRGPQSWCWRGGWPWRDGFLEWQIRLTEDTEGAAFHETAPGEGPGRGASRTSVVYGIEPRRDEWRGSLAQGVRTSVDVALDVATGDMELPFLRLEVRSPSFSYQQGLCRDRLDLARILALVAGILGFGVWLGPRGFAAAGIACTRIFMVAVDLPGALAAASESGLGSVSPTDLSSLIDSAYFKSDLGWGLFGSALDALLSAVCLAAILYLLLARRPKAAAGPRPGGRTRLRAVGLGLATGLALLLIRSIATEFVTNANARLIGSSIPLQSWTFWSLHLSLLIFGGALLGALAAASIRIGVRRSAPTVLLHAVAAWLPVLALDRFGSGDLPLSCHVLLPLVACLLWWGTALLPSADGLLRRLGWLLPLLLSIVWTYVSLSGTYETVRQTWLQRRAEEIADSREEWVSYLLEDLLTDIAGLEVELEPADGAHARDADSLWRDWSAFELWRRAGVGDLGLSGELEIIDEGGGTSGLYASGFFRDYGYELVERSDWEDGPVVMPRIGLESTIYLQRERRRFAAGEEWILRGEISQIDSKGWISLALPVRSSRISTLSRRFLYRSPDAAGGYVPRVDLDRPLLMMYGDDGGWLDTGDKDLPAEDSADVIAALRSGRAPWGRVEVGDETYLCIWRPAGGPETMPGEGFLLGFKIEGFAEKLLDLSRLILLDLLLLISLIALVLFIRLLSGRRPAAGSGGLGFQEQFLAVYLVIGLLPLLLAGMFIDRLNQDWLSEGARQETAAGLDAAREQLQGLLAEQARALAGSDYISELLDSRLAGRRPLGPYSARQAMVFTSDGDLLLDETLSDLDTDEAAALLAVAKRNALVMMQDSGGLYMGTLIPVDLTGVPTLSEMEGMPTRMTSPVRRNRDGYFFYRQRLGPDLMAGLGEVIQGEAALHIGGEAVLASHPGNVFSGRTPLLMSPGVARQLRRSPGNTFLKPSPGQRLAWTGMLSLPLMVNVQPGSILREAQPAVLSVIFPARERDSAEQRQRTMLFLAGLATLIFLTATLLGLALTWKIFDPVRVLVGATRRLAAGDYDAPLPEPGKDELGTLSTTFRGMRDDLRNAQRTLAESERFLSGVLEGVPVGVAVLDTDRVPMIVNPAAWRMADIHYGEAGEPDDRIRMLLAGFERALDGREGEAELVSPDGRRTLRGRLATLELPDKRRHTMIVCEDVTEFLRTKKLALNAQMARQVAHEVKNPLTPIQLSVQFLQQAWKDKAENLDGIVESTVSQVLEQVALLRSIATEFSLLGRPDEMECSALDFQDVVRGVVEKYRDGGPRIRWRDRALPPVSAHGESLAKVVTNLMENSIQAASGDRPLEIGIDWIVGARTLDLVWTDNGSGLVPDVAGRLFDPYFSTKKQGTGLGLPICRSLLSGMGGSISLRNREDGTGATAIVSLPLADPRSGDDPEGTP